MLAIESKALRLTMNAQGEEVVLEDKARGQRWRLDPASRWVSRQVRRFQYEDRGYLPEVRRRPEAGIFTVGAGQARKLDEQTLEALHATPAGTVKLRWRVEADRLRVTADPRIEQPATSLALPGAFLPEGQATFQAAVPNLQGALYSGRGEAYCRPLPRHSHAHGRSLDMFGQLAARGGLSVIAETALDATLWHEKAAEGPPTVLWLQHASLGELRYPREVVIIPTDANLTAVCKAYRKYEIEQGRFKTWAEKVAERPALEKLFGAALIFIGYFQDDQLDYADAFRRLHAQGIDRAFIYPLYCASTLDMRKAVGVPGVDVRHLAPLVKELGWMPGSFLYLVDGPTAYENPADDPDMLQLEDGQANLLWQVREHKWYTYGAAKREAVAREHIARDLPGLEGLHYDVLTTRSLEDWNPRHPTDARGMAEAMRAMLDEAAHAGMLVSSEGFFGRMTPHYDLGNTKFPRAVAGGDYCVVPMSMLVYHDSAYQTWWEVDNYNNPEHHIQAQGRGYQRHFPMFGGAPELQSCWDALMGTPPDVFPFGLQYGFQPHSHTDYYFYRCRLEDPMVQRALACAKPVMQLNRRIGPLEMVEHKLHHPEGALQETVFADGTRVVANFANVGLELPKAAGGGLLAGESWKVV